MFCKTLFMALVCYSIGANSFVVGDVAPNTPKSLSDVATTIIIGRITNLEIKEEPGDSGFTDLALYYTIDVSAVEKGQAKQPGDQVVVRAWTWKERKRSYPGSHGHNPLPAVGEEVRVFLRGTNVELPNGFAPTVSLDTVTDKEFFKLQYAIKKTDQYQAMMLDGGDPALMIDDRDPAAEGGLRKGWILVIIGLFAVFCAVIFVLRFQRVGLGPSVTEDHPQETDAEPSD
jgi:hypothetical protein